MKKLMMAAAIVCAAVGVQAATVQWSAADFVDVNGVALSDTSVGMTAITTFYDANGTQLASTTGELTQIPELMGSFDGSWTGAATSTAYKYQTIVTDDEGNTLTSAMTDFSTTSSATLSLAVTFDQSGSTHGWVTVPEPTSGLLLLLGMAGLALKRKRA